MAVRLIVPLPFFQLYAECRDDSVPNKLVPSEWIKENRWYKIKHFVENSLNTDGSTVTITDKDNNEIHPTDTIWSFRPERFKIHHICLN